jgi:hypothetical protein
VEVDAMHGWMSSLEGVWFWRVTRVLWSGLLIGWWFVENWYKVFYFCCVLTVYIHRLLYTHNGMDQNITNVKCFQNVLFAQLNKKFFVI